MEELGDSSQVLVVAETAEELHDDYGGEKTISKIKHLKLMLAEKEAQVRQAKYDVNKKDSKTSELKGILKDRDDEIAELNKNYPSSAFRWNSKKLVKYSFTPAPHPPTARNPAHAQSLI